MTKQTQPCSYATLLASLLLGAGIARADLSTGLVAWYPLNGDATDGSGNGQNGVASGVVYVPDRFGVGNRAARF